jgi:hypothetical protein
MDLRTAREAMVVTGGITETIDWISGDPNEDNDEESPYGFNETFESEPEGDDDEDDE